MSDGAHKSRHHRAKVSDFLADIYLPKTESEQEAIRKRDYRPSRDYSAKVTSPTKRTRSRGTYTAQVNPRDERDKSPLHRKRNNNHHKVSGCAEKHPSKTELVPSTTGRQIYKPPPSKKDSLPEKRARSRSACTTHGESSKTLKLLDDDKSRSKGNHEHKNKKTSRSHTEILPDAPKEDWVKPGKRRSKRIALRRAQQCMAVWPWFDDFDDSKRVSKPKQTKNNLVANVKTSNTRMCLYPMECEAALCPPSMKDVSKENTKKVETCKEVKRAKKVAPKAAKDRKLPLNFSSAENLFSMSNETDSHKTAKDDDLPKTKTVLKKRKRQTCRGQFRHKNIQVFKLGADQGPLKDAAQKNQALNKIFLRRSSAPSLPSTLQKTGKKQGICEYSIVNKLDDADSANSDKKKDAINNNNSDPFNYGAQDIINNNNSDTINYGLHKPYQMHSVNLNVGRDTDRFPKVVPTSLASQNEANSAVNSVTCEKQHVQGSFKKHYLQENVFPQIDPSSNVQEVGKHNLPVRIPERRSSIAEPLVKSVTTKINYQNSKQKNSTSNLDRSLNNKQDVISAKPEVTPESITVANQYTKDQNMAKTNEKQQRNLINDIPHDLPQNLSIHSMDSNSTCQNPPKIDPRRISKAQNLNVLESTPFISPNSNPSAIPNNFPRNDIYNYCYPDMTVPNQQGFARSSSLQETVPNNPSDYSQNRRRGKRSSSYTSHDDFSQKITKPNFFYEPHASHFPPTVPCNYEYNDANHIYPFDTVRPNFYSTDSYYEPVNFVTSAPLFNQENFPYPPYFPTTIYDPKYIPFSNSMPPTAFEYNYPLNMEIGSHPSNVPPTYAPDDHLQFNIQNAPLALLKHSSPQDYNILSPKSTSEITITKIPVQNTDQKSDSSKRSDAFNTDVRITKVKPNAGFDTTKERKNIDRIFHDEAANISISIVKSKENSLHKCDSPKESVPVVICTKLPDKNNTSNDETVCNTSKNTDAENYYTQTLDSKSKTKPYQNNTAEQLQPEINCRIRPIELNFENKKSSEVDPTVNTKPDEAKEIANVIQDIVKKKDVRMFEEYVETLRKSLKNENRHTKETSTEIEIKQDKADNQNILANIKETVPTESASNSNTQDISNQNNVHKSGGFSINLDNSAKNLQNGTERASAALSEPANLTAEITELEVKIKEEVLDDDDLEIVYSSFDTIKEDKGIQADFPTEKHKLTPPIQKKRKRQKFIGKPNDQMLRINKYSRVYVNNLVNKKFECLKNSISKLSSKPTSKNDKLSSVSEDNAQRQHNSGINFLLNDTNLINSNESKMLQKQTSTIISNTTENTNGSLITDDLEITPCTIKKDISDINVNKPSNSSSFTITATENITNLSATDNFSCKDSVIYHEKSTRKEGSFPLPKLSDNKTLPKLDQCLNKHTSGLTHTTAEYKNNFSSTSTANNDSLTNKNVSKIVNSSTEKCSNTKSTTSTEETSTSDLSGTTTNSNMGSEIQVSRAPTEVSQTERFCSSTSTTKIHSAPSEVLSTRGTFSSTSTANNVSVTNKNGSKVIDSSTEKISNTKSTTSTEETSITDLSGTTTNSNMGSEIQVSRAPTDVWQTERVCNSTTTNIHSALSKVLSRRDNFSSTNTANYVSATNKNGSKVIDSSTEKVSNTKSTTSTEGTSTNDLSGITTNSNRKSEMQVSHAPTKVSQKERFGNSTSTTSIHSAPSEVLNRGANFSFTDTANNDAVTNKNVSKILNTSTEKFSNTKSTTTSTEGTSRSVLSETTTNSNWKSEVLVSQAPTEVSQKGRFCNSTTTNMHPAPSEVLSRPNFSSTTTVNNDSVTNKNVSKIINVSVEKFNNTKSNTLTDGTSTSDLSATTNSDRKSEMHVSHAPTKVSQKERLCNSTSTNIHSAPREVSSRRANFSSTSTANNDSVPNQNVSKIINSSTEKCSNTKSTTSSEGTSTSDLSGTTTNSNRKSEMQVCHAPIPVLVTGRFCTSTTTNIHSAPSEVLSISANFSSTSTANNDSVTNKNGSKVIDSSTEKLNNTRSTTSTERTSTSDLSGTTTNSNRKSEIQVSHAPIPVVLTGRFCSSTATNIHSVPSEVLSIRANFSSTSTANSDTVTNKNGSKVIDSLTEKFSNTRSTTSTEGTSTSDPSGTTTNSNRKSEMQVPHAPTEVSQKGRFCNRTTTNIHSAPSEVSNRRATGIETVPFKMITRSSALIRSSAEPLLSSDSISIRKSEMSKNPLSTAASKETIDKLAYRNSTSIESLQKKGSQKDNVTGMHSQPKKNTDSETPTVSASNDTLVPRNSASTEQAKTCNNNVHITKTFPQLCRSSTVLSEASKAMSSGVAPKNTISIIKIHKGIPTEAVQKANSKDFIASKIQTESYINGNSKSFKIPVTTTSVTSTNTIDTVLSCGSSSTDPIRKDNSKMSKTSFTSASAKNSEILASKTREPLQKENLTKDLTTTIAINKNSSITDSSVLYANPIPSGNSMSTEPLHRANSKSFKIPVTTTTATSLTSTNTIDAVVSWGSSSTDPKRKDWKMSKTSFTSASAKNSAILASRIREPLQNSAKDFTTTTPINKISSIVVSSMSHTNPISIGNSMSTEPLQRMNSKDLNKINSESSHASVNGVPTISRGSADLKVKFVHLPSPTMAAVPYKNYYHSKDTEHAPINLNSQIPVNMTLSDTSSQISRPEVNSYSLAANSKQTKNPLIHTLQFTPKVRNESFKCIPQQYPLNGRVPTKDAPTQMKTVQNNVCTTNAEKSNQPYNLSTKTNKYYPDIPKPDPRAYSPNGTKITSPVKTTIGYPFDPVDNRLVSRWNPLNAVAKSTLLPPKPALPGKLLSPKETRFPEHASSQYYPHALKTPTTVPYVPYRPHFYEPVKTMKDRRDPSIHSTVPSQIPINIDPKHDQNREIDLSASKATEASKLRKHRKSIKDVEPKEAVDISSQHSAVRTENKPPAYHSSNLHQPFDNRLSDNVGLLYSNPYCFPANQNLFAHDLKRIYNYPKPISNNPFTSLPVSGSTSTNSYLSSAKVVPPPPYRPPYLNYNNSGTFRQVGQTQPIEEESSLTNSLPNTNIACPDASKISSILPKLHDDAVLSAEQYVKEMNILHDNGCPRPFLEFYAYVTKKQITGNQKPIGFKIFLELHNAGKLKEFEKFFQIYSEKHEKEKKKQLDGIS